MDLFEVTNSTLNPSQVKIRKVAKRHMYCDWNGIKHCSPDTGAGIYVDRGGRLILYGTEHYATGLENSGFGDQASCAERIADY